MRADDAAGQAEPTADSPQGGRTRRLAAALRTGATEAAERVGGGIALVFAVEGDGPPRLRAAAGFALPDAARETAHELLQEIDAVVRSGEPARRDPIASLGERAAGGIVIHPLTMPDQRHGAFVVGSPGEISPDAGADLERIADRLALWLDHARLETQIERLGSRSRGADPGEEVLRLSEALFAQDIELLRSHEKLGKIEKLKNDFIEKMSRELRTPLNSIIEAIISVITGENEALSEAAKTSLRAALDDGTAFLRTLQNILDLWRIKQGELPVESQDVNFREVVDEAIFSIQESLDGKALRVEQQLEQPLPKIRTDLAKISQILFLLLENAAKFTPQGIIEISARVQDGILSCEIRDTGIGICPDDQQFIFDEFYQVDESSSKRYSGAGLGLALVRDLIVLLEGEISVQSDVGTGTSVRVQIPVQAV